MLHPILRAVTVDLKANSHIRSAKKPLKFIIIVNFKAHFFCCRFQQCSTTPFMLTELWPLAVSRFSPGLTFDAKSAALALCLLRLIL